MGCKWAQLEAQRFFFQARNLPVLSVPPLHMIISHSDYCTGLQSGCSQQERAIPCLTGNSGFWIPASQEHQCSVNKLKFRVINSFLSLISSWIGFSLHTQRKCWTCCKPPCETEYGEKNPKLFFKQIFKLSTEKKKRIRRETCQLWKAKKIQAFLNRIYQGQKILCSSKFASSGDKDSIISFGVRENSIWNLRILLIQCKRQAPTWQNW